jgi:replicative DNA helicase
VEKLLPQNIEAECGVLGSIIIDPEAIVQVADFLHAEDFYRDAHRTIYEVIIQLYEQHEPADFITICDELERRNRLEQVGGASYITSLINQVPTSGNVEYYGHIVERTAILRRLIHAAGQIAAIAYEEADADVALEKAEQLIFAISQGHARADFSALRDILGDYMSKLEQLHERRGSIVGVPTGFTDLDRLTGGLQRSDLIILAARPAVGKCLTAWTLIDDPTTGERLTIEECVQRRLSSVYGLSEDGKIRSTEIGDWIDSGVQPCYRVQTLTGRMVEVTGHHPFLTVNGWVPLHDLQVGDSIAVPAAVPAFGNDESWSLEKVRLLAYSIADDNSAQVAPVLTHAPTGGGKTMTLILPSLLEKARHRGFPSYVWQWSREHLAEFLRVLMSCSGSIDVREGHLHIELAVTSQQLAADVHHAFIRFGIIARHYQVNAKSWCVAITSPQSVQLYQEQIGRIEKNHLANYVVTKTHETTNSDIYWDKIVAIEAIGEHQVYDLTVPDGANFVAQDVLVHNTSFALSLAHNSASRHQQSVAVFSLEMSKEQLVQRILSMDAGIDQQRLRTGWIEDDEWERIVYSMDKLSEANIWIDDTAGISTMEMRSKARRLHAEHGLDLIVVDYLQIMQSEIGGRRMENRVQEVSEISRSLKGLARELNVPVLALAQLSRTVESRQSKVPQLSDLRESGCVTGDTLVYLPDEGIHKPIEQLIGQKGFRVLSLNTETWQLEPREVTNAFATGCKPVYKMKTRLGKKIRATANHKFLTMEGWKRLDELEKGKRIAACEQLSKLAQSDVYWDEIVSIEPDGEAEVYDLTVGYTHNFIGNTIIVHNSIEQDADIVMFIYRDEVYNPETERKNIADIIVAKHRNGPVGEISLFSQASQTRFCDLEVSPPAEE